MLDALTRIELRIEDVTFGPDERRRILRARLLALANHVAPDWPRDLSGRFTGWGAGFPAAGPPDQ